VPRPAPRSRRRGVFGRDPAAYERARLAYPPRVFATLRRRCALRPGCRVLEIGPGTGKATRELLRAGAGPVTLVERDVRLARYLRDRLGEGASRVELKVAAFESVRLPPASFDLVVAASSFHWMPRRRALRKVARLLRPGGWWAAWGNQHNDPSRPTRFRRALDPLYDELGGRHRSIGHTTATRRWDREERRRMFADLRAVGTFDRIACVDLRWSVVLSTRQVVALWGSFSDVVTLPPDARRRFLAAIRRLVDDRFGGRVRLPIRTPVYLARRRVGRPR